MKTNPPKVSIPTTTDAHVAAVVAERGKVYGDPFKSHRHIGMSWTALIQQHFDIELPHAIPASLVAQMMVAFKNQRSCRKHHADNLIDGRAYQGFADDFQQREELSKEMRMDSSCPIQADSVWQDYLGNRVKFRYWRSKPFQPNLLGEVGFSYLDKIRDDTSMPWRDFLKHFTEVIPNDTTCVGAHTTSPPDRESTSVAISELKKHNPGKWKRLSEFKPTKQQQADLKRFVAKAKASGKRFKKAMKSK